MCLHMWPDMKITNNSNPCIFWLPIVDFLWLVFQNLANYDFFSQNSFVCVKIIFFRLKKWKFIKEKKTLQLEDPDCHDSQVVNYALNASKICGAFFGFVLGLMNGDDSLQNKSTPTYGRKMKNLYMFDGFFLIVYRIEKQPFVLEWSLCPRVESKDK